MIFNFFQIKVLFSFSKIVFIGLQMDIRVIELKV